MDIYIIGGGAAGLAAAISAGRQVTAVFADKERKTAYGKGAGGGHADVRIHILEKKEAVGKKVLASGNGRCNFTNSSCDRAGETLEFFYSLGVIPREEEEGRVYPYCEQAAAVVSALERECERLGVEIITGFSVTEVRRQWSVTSGQESVIGGQRTVNRGQESGVSGQSRENLEIRGDSLEDIDQGLAGDGRKTAGDKGCGYLISGTDAKGRVRKFHADKLLIATGGKAGAQFGCTGDGYKWAKELGHSINTVYPVLTPIECAEEMKTLKGVRARGKAGLYKNGNLLSEEYGEIQFLEDGLSGICVFNLSRFLKREKLSGESFASTGFESYELRLDLAPDFGSEAVSAMLRENPFCIESFVPKKLAEYLLRRALEESIAVSEGVSLFKIMKNIGNLDNTADRLAGLLKCCTFKVKGAKGWKNAQVTAGGVALEEIDLNTMQSRKAKGLYFAGEIIDFDGPCGGYNLQNAWETGIKAGKAMAESLR